MAKNIKEERLRWVVPIWKEEVKLSDAAKICPYSKRSLERWLALYKKFGAWALEPKSTEPKTYRVETPIRIKERVIEIRKKTGKCAKKIYWQLKKEGIDIHWRTIGKILKKENQVRKYRSIKIKYKYIRAERKPGELLEIDVKYVPGRVLNKRYYQFTAIDTASRWRYLDVYMASPTISSILASQPRTARWNEATGKIRRSSTREINSETLPICEESCGYGMITITIWNTADWKARLRMNFLPIMSYLIRQMCVISSL